MSVETDRKSLLILVFILACTGPGAYAQDTLYFRSAEDSLVYLANRIVEPHADLLRLENNAAFKSHLEQVLQKEASFYYPFDSLRTVSILYAPDNRFRLITWYVPLAGGSFRYFGIFQKGECDLIGDDLIWLEHSITDTDIRDPGVLSAGEWYGAYYYDIIHHVHEGTDIYTLLAWKGKDRLSRIRLIEPLVIENGVPHFGRRVFDRPYEENFRIVFEYSASVSMSLQYERDFILDGGERGSMIVFDRLEPRSENLRGHYQFYFPEVNIFDGLVLREGRWVLLQDVDARMPDNRR